MDYKDSNRFQHRLEKHPAKTSIGRTARGFDFLGYRFDTQKITGVSQTSLDRFIANMHRLYEQQSL